VSSGEPLLASRLHELPLPLLLLLARPTGRGLVFRLKAISVAIPETERVAPVLNVPHCFIPSPSTTIGQNPYTWFRFGKVVLEGGCPALALAFLTKAVSLLPVGLQRQEKVGWCVFDGSENIPPC